MLPTTLYGSVKALPSVSYCAIGESRIPADSSWSLVVIPLVLVSIQFCLEPTVEDTGRALSDSHAAQ